MSDHDADPARIDEIRRQAAARLEDLRDEGLWALPRRTPAAPADADAAPDGAATGAATSDGPTRPGATRPATLFEPGDAEPIEPAQEPLATVEAEALVCTRCKLHEGRTKVVFGVGDPAADLMFIGEGPGRDEDLQGEPFVGRAGQLLDRIIDAMGLSRDRVYIANAVKCRPPNNRNPEADELDACRPYLMRQVACVGPRVIVLLGRVAVQTVLGRETALSRLRGRFHDWRGIPVMCTYHPAYLLRNPKAKRMVWEDMQQVMVLLAGTGT